MEENITEGVRLCVESWSAFELAEDMGWGETSHKQLLLDELTDIVLHCHIDEEKLEDYLQEFMEVNYNVVLEDDSAKDVAKILVNLYEESKAGRTEQLAALRRIKQSKAKPQEPTQESMDIEPAVPIVDEEGIEVVQSKKKKRHN